MGCFPQRNSDSCAKPLGSIVIRFAAGLDIVGFIFPLPLILAAGLLHVRPTLGTQPHDESCKRCNSAYSVRMGCLAYSHPAPLLAQAYSGRYCDYPLLHTLDDAQL